MMQAEKAHLGQYFLVRWFDVATFEAIRDDGIQNDTAFGFATMAYTFVCSSVAEAKRIVVDTIINDELVDNYDDNDNELEVKPTDFTWDDEHSPQYACEYMNEIVAGVYITPLNEFVIDAPSDGGPA